MNFWSEGPARSSARLGVTCPQELQKIQKIRSETNGYKDNGHKCGKVGNVNYLLKI